MSAIRRVALATLCAAAFGPALAGCGGDSGVEAADRPKPAAPTAEARRQRSDPLSPASMVMKFWKSVQQGALPLTLELYDPKVVSSVGISTFAGMLGEQRAGTQDVRLNILRVENVAGGRLVTAETLPRVGLKTRHTFFLRTVPRRSPIRWRIVYDTLSAGAIQTYVQSQTQRSVDPAAAPGRKAVAAGDAAAEAYRRASLVPARRPPRPARASAPAPTATATPRTPATTTTMP